MWLPHPSLSASYRAAVWAGPIGLRQSRWEQPGFPGDMLSACRSCANRRRAGSSEHQKNRPSSVVLTRRHRGLLRLTCSPHGPRALPGEGGSSAGWAWRCGGEPLSQSHARAGMTAGVAGAKGEKQAPTDEPAARGGRMGGEAISSERNSETSPRSDRRNETGLRGQRPRGKDG